MPTVYKHFPDRASLLRGCTSHAARDAPFVGVEVFAGLAEPLERFGALVEALYARHAYMEPWLRWAEHRVDPALSVIVTQMERAVAELIGAALSDGRQRPRRPALALAVALCSYPSWEIMVRHHGLPTREAARAAIFPLVRDAIASVLPPQSLRYVGLSHVEADECGSLHDFLALAPNAVALCGQVAAMVSGSDLGSRPARALADGETLALGAHTLR